MKKVWLFLGAVIVVAALTVIVIIPSEKKFETLGANLSSTNVLLGTSQSFGRMASSTTFGDYISAIGTTTPFYITTTTQRVVTDGYDKVRLLVSAKGLTPTSTVSIRQMVSDDGVNYFNLSNSTSTDETTGVGTTTLSTAPRIVQFAPGVSTTSLAITFDVYGYKYTRFLLTGDDATTDPTDGTFAWITAVSVK